MTTGSATSPDVGTMSGAGRRRRVNRGHVLWRLVACWIVAGVLATSCHASPTIDEDPQATGVRSATTGARAPSRDVEVRLRETDDGSAPPGTRVELPRLRVTFHRAGFSFHDLDGAQLPRGPNVRAPRRDEDVHDKHGVRMVEVDGRYFDHPNYQANFGLENLESYRQTGDRFFLERAEAQAQRLIDTRVAWRGAWFYPYTFDFPLHGNPDDMVHAPWFSGLAQGKALSLFSRLAHVTGSEKWREAADRTFASFVVGLLLPGPSSMKQDGPWFVAVDSDKLVWFVQHPGATLADSDIIYNGHLAAVFGLWEYYKLSRNPDALALYDGGVTTILEHLGDIRVPGRPSRYCLTHGADAANTYHRLHVEQFVQLWLMTRKAVFIQFAETLRDDNPYPVLARRRTVDLRAGNHVGYRVDLATNRVLERREVALQHAATATTVRRMRLRGQPDMPGGVYYRLASGPRALYDTWVREEAGKVMIRGPVAVISYRGHRRMVFEAGRSYVLAKLDAVGNRVETRRVPFDENTVVSVDRSGWLEGRSAIRLASGRYAGWWVTVAGGVSDYEPASPG